MSTSDDEIDRRAETLERLNNDIKALWQEAIDKGYVTAEKAKLFEDQFDELAFAELLGRITEDEAKLIVHNLAKNGKNPQ